MKKVLFGLAVSLILTVAHGQTEKINQIDSAGKQHGKWIVYLDYYWKTVKDSNEAVYYRYTYFDHGINTIRMGSRGSKGWKFEPATDTAGQKGKVKILDGEYKSFDKKGQLKFIQVFDKGEYVSYKEFNKSGKLYTRFDYKKKLNNEPNTYAIYIHRKNGDVECYYMSKGKYGWMAYGSPSDSVAKDTLKTIGDSTFATISYYLNGKLIGRQDKISVKAIGQSGQAPFKILHGQSTTWYYNGQKKSEGQFYYGKKTGQWKYWNKNGKEIQPKESS